MPLWTNPNSEQYTGENERDWLKSYVDRIMARHRETAPIDHPNGSVGTAALADNAVTTPKLAGSAVTDEKIGARTVSDPAADSGTVSGLFTNIINQAVAALRSFRQRYTRHVAGTEDKHKAQDITYSGSVAGANVKAAVDQLQSNLNAHKNASSLDHPAGSVTDAKIAAGAVTNIKIKNDAVTDEKIGGRTVQDPAADMGVVSGALTSLFDGIAQAIRGIRGGGIKNVVKTINHIPPDANGNCTLIVDGLPVYTGDADTLDGKHAAEFLLKSGDTVEGRFRIKENLSIDGRSINSDATGPGSLAHGTACIASGAEAYAGGSFARAFGARAHAEGSLTVAYGRNAHAEGTSTVAGQHYDHAEGYAASTGVAYSVITKVDRASNKVTIKDVLELDIGEEINLVSCQRYADGGSNGMEIARVVSVNGNEVEVEAISTVIIAGGFLVKIGGIGGTIITAAHAEGFCTITTTVSGHAEGWGGIANGIAAHAENLETLAGGDGSHAGGYKTVANSFLEHAQGQFNTISATPPESYNATADAFKIGNGLSDNARSNAFRVTFDGRVFGRSAFNSTGADYAEFFEWADGNPDNEERIGYFVTLDGDRIRIAAQDDYILGVISTNPAVVGNSHNDVWSEMYLTDIWGRPVLEEAEALRTTKIHDDGQPGEAARDFAAGRILHKLNPDYDPEQAYIPREQRPEWGVVGMLGQLYVHDDGTCEVNGYCRPGKDGTATQSATGYRVIARIDDRHIKILFR